MLIFFFFGPLRCLESGIGTIHCLIVVPLSIVALNRRNTNWLHLTYLDANSALEQRIIELSVGYFVADFVHFILFEPDFLMFFHHVFSILMMGSAGIIGRGAACATTALVQGEITNPFQSAWTVARTAKAEKLLVWLSPLFTVVFVVVRIFGVPTWTSILIYDLWTSPNRKLMPAGVVEWWSAMAVLMTLGGFAWSYSLIKGLIKFYKNKARASKGDSKKKQ